jgi:hypothetical protein
MDLIPGTESLYLEAIDHDLKNIYNWNKRFQIFLDVFIGLMVFIMLYGIFENIGYAGVILAIIFLL